MLLINNMSPPYARPQLYDAQRDYGGTIRYYIDPSLQSRTFEINGTSVRLDFRKHIEEAMAEWNEALRGTLTFVEGSVTNRNVVIRMANSIEEDTILNPHHIAALSVAKDDPTNVNNYGSIIISMDIDNHERFSVTHLIEKKLFENNAPQDVLDCYTRWLFKHEIGHLFGLMHPILITPDTTNVIEYHSPVTISNLDNPIMDPDLFNYYQVLAEGVRQQFDRRLRIGDIHIPEHEAIVVRDSPRMQQNWATNATCIATSSRLARFVLEKKTDCVSLKPYLLSTTIQLLLN